MDEQTTLMEEQLIELKKDIEDYYKKAQGLDITYIKINEEGLLQIDYVEAVGGGFASVGDFTIDLNDLKAEMEDFYNQGGK